MLRILFPVIVFFLDTVFPELLRRFLDLSYFGFLSGCFNQDLVCLCVHILMVKKVTPFTMFFEANVIHTEFLTSNELSSFILVLCIFKL